MTQWLLTCSPKGSSGLVSLLFVPCVEQVSYIQKGSLQLFTTVVFVLLQLPLFLIMSDFGYEGVIKIGFNVTPLGMESVAEADAMYREQSVCILPQAPS